MAEPITTYDIEFGFLNGSTQFVTVQEGRDRIAVDDVRVRAELHPDPDTVEEVIVHRSALAYMRSTKRTMQPTPTFEDYVESATGATVS